MQADHLPLLYSDAEADCETDLAADAQGGSSLTADRLLFLFLLFLLLPSQPFLDKP